MSAAIRTLIVEDDPLLAEAHSQFTDRVPGFRVVGAAAQGAEALRLLRVSSIDLVLLDFYLPDMTGLDLCRSLRAHGDSVDVIAVTSARDLNMVREALSLGVLQYLIKPFTFATFRDKLVAYADYRRHTDQAGDSGLLGQDDVDRALAALRETGEAQLPKGLTGSTLTAVVERLRAGEPLTSATIAEAVGMARPTARRYLEYLADQRLVSREPRYGSAGRPEHVYRWAGKR